MSEHQPPTRTDDARHPDEAGLTTAEYAVGTLGAVTIGGVLLTLGGSGFFQDLFRQLLAWMLSNIAGAPSVFLGG